MIIVVEVINLKSITLKQSDIKQWSSAANIKLFIGLYIYIILLFHLI